MLIRIMAPTIAATVHPIVFQRYYYYYYSNNCFYSLCYHCLLILFVRRIMFDYLSSEMPLFGRRCWALTEILQIWMKQRIGMDLARDFRQVLTANICSNSGRILVFLFFEFLLSSLFDIDSVYLFQYRYRFGNLYSVAGTERASQMEMAVGSVFAYQTNRDSNDKKRLC